MNTILNMVVTTFITKSLSTMVEREFEGEEIDFHMLYDIWLTNKDAKSLTIQTGDMIMMRYICQTIKKKKIIKDGSIVYQKLN